MSKKQTAVEWLIEKQLDAGIGLPKEWREQAKEMEKEQMIDFASLFANSDSVYIEYDCEDCPAELTIESPDRLFELTYGGNK
jgi:hypothetical protein